jgi:hypothetical protein
MYVRRGEPNDDSADRLAAPAVSIRAQPETVGHAATIEDLDLIRFADAWSPAENVLIDVPGRNGYTPTFVIQDNDGQSRITITLHKHDCLLAGFECDFEGNAFETLNRRDSLQATVGRPRLGGSFHAQ